VQGASLAEQGKGAKAKFEAAYEAYRAARYLMRQAIRKAKAKSWEDLLTSLDADPWERPYKMVFGKLRTAAPPVVGALAPDLLTEVVGTLFPVRGRCIPLRSTGPIPWREEWIVTDREMSVAGKRLGRGNKAPGPDGVHGRVLALAMGEKLKHLFIRCLQSGTFPLSGRRPP
jgi:hypothetical protein